jgi:hypothetical protein
MTVPTFTLSSLRAAKNAAIGNPLAKLQLVRDQVFISQSVCNLRKSKTLAHNPEDSSMYLIPNTTPLRQQQRDPKMRYE